MHPILLRVRQSLQGLYPPEEVKALSLLICSEMVGIPVVDLYAGKDTILSDRQEEKLNEILQRMQAHEPIQYIAGEALFGGRMFKVNRGVLIPRPETWELLQLIVAEQPHARRLLDIGTGSGALAISLALELGAEEVEGWDISPEALVVARQNASRLGATVQFRQVDVLDEAAVEQTVGSRLFDVLVSNPPYIAQAEKETMEVHVTDWEPELALFVPDADLLIFYRQIAQLGRRFLASGGTVYVEINQAYGEETRSLFVDADYTEVRLLKDMFDNDRFVVARL